MFAGPLNFQTGNAFRVIRCPDEDPCQDIRPAKTHAGPSSKSRKALISRFLTSTSSFVPSSGLLSTLHWQRELSVLFFDWVYKVATGLTKVGSQFFEKFSITNPTYLKHLWDGYGCSCFKGIALSNVGAPRRCHRDYEGNAEIRDN